MGNILPDRRDLKDENAKPEKVIEPTVLIAVGERMVETAITKEADENARTKDMMSQWQLDGLLNIVTEDSFFNIVSAGLGGMRKTLVNQQPNGDWQPQAYEFEIRPGRQEQPELFMGIRWVDVNNEETIVYGSNGQPIVNVNVHTKNNEDSELKDILKLLAQRQISNDSLIEALQDANDKANAIKSDADAPVVENEPAPKKTRKVKRS
tara:strand:- start:1070 stop:1693 length:624 start_codon:yes stop_codon:yes gene_type:complete